MVKKYIAGKKNLIAFVILFAVPLIALPPESAVAQENNLGTTWEQVKNEFDTLNVLGIQKPAPQNSSEVFASGQGQAGLLGAESIIGRIIGWILGLVGSIALIMFVYAGITWMVAIGHGASESAAKAQKIILFAAIGLIVVFASYFIVSFLFNIFIVKEII